MIIYAKFDLVINGLQFRTPGEAKAFMARIRLAIEAVEHDAPTLDEIFTDGRTVQQVADAEIAMRFRRYPDVGLRLEASTTRVEHVKLKD